MNTVKERVIALFLILTLVFSIFIGVVSSSEVSLASEENSINISENKVVKGNSVYINPASEGDIKEDSTAIFKNEEGKTLEFVAQYNDDADFYYFDLNFEEADNWKLVGGSIFSNQELVITVYDNLKEMTGYSEGYIDVSEVENAKIEGKDLNFLLTRVKGYNSDGSFAEVIANVDGESNNAFTMGSEGLARSISVIENYTLKAGVHEFKLETKDYSTSVKITLNSDYGTEIETETIPEKSNKLYTMAAGSSSTVFARYQGSNRYETAVKVSQSKYSSDGANGSVKAGAVVLVNGTKSSDMSVAAAFAKQKNAPVLLVDKDTLTTVTLNEIKRLKVKDVYAIGGTGSISSKVEDELAKNGVTLKKRFAGIDTYETSVLVVKDLLATTNKGTAIIMSGANYYDSLSAASLSASKVFPVLCVKPNSLPENVKTAIKDGGFTDAIIIGGTSTISKSVEDEVKTVIKGNKTTRISGANRYSTSVAIAKKYFPNTKIFNIATGKTYADALPGAAVAGVNDSPIIVVGTDTISADLRSYINSLTGLKGIYIYGGAVSVSSIFEARLQKVALGFKDVCILLDPGHASGRTHNRGYVGAKWKNEGDGNYAFSLILKKELEAYGIIVGTTRPANTAYDKPLADRGKEAQGYDLFISLHTNAANRNMAGTAQGVEIYNSVNKTGAASLAKNLTNTISSTLSNTNRKVKYRYYDETVSIGSPIPGKTTDYYGVLRANLAPAGMLIEHCFHDNASDVAKYEARATTLAKNMAATIASYYGLR
ncbi:cell wall-binding repeat-containing protein [Peptostreptococcaceae bacterium OttesenSCG-928-C18]|nr:cell wall-binding repeat-containing protein [Peptostreptococcaceae bacterium OttesenSCG-928-C18]